MGERLVCDCGGTMPLDGERLGCTVHSRLCREELPRFEAALANGAPLVACTQEAPLFREVAEAFGVEPGFVNVRERAGWTERGDPNAKVAALLAEAATARAEPRLLEIASGGHALVVGQGQVALDAALTLAERMAAVSLVLTGGEGDVLLPTTLPFPILLATDLRLSGSLGAFALHLPEGRRLDPSSRRAPLFGPPGAIEIAADLVLDLSGATPLVTGPHKRDGYERADPRDPAAVARALLAATGWDGEFLKPIYVAYDPSICAHSRNRITGCTNCLDACPAGAIEPAGDGVAIDARICAGCGSCASHCPTGAVAYSAPPREDLTARVGVLLDAYRNAGGERPVLLLHAEGHGGALIDASARLGRGLPVEVLPLGLHAATVPGHDHMLHAAAAGAGAVAVLVDPRRADEAGALESEVAIANAILAGLGHPCRASVLTESDPDAMEDALEAIVAGSATPAPSPALPAANKREAARNAFAALGGASVEPFALPADAPYGRIHVDAAACTLCMACVSACPADAIRDNPERPQLRFVESECVQCGICAKTCPENAITLEARLDPRPAAQAPVTLNEEEPAACVRCHTPFAAASTVERMVEKLSDHWMYRGERARLLRMCDACRLEEQAAGGRDPFAAAERPRPRTTEDYVAAGDKGLTVDDFLN